MVFGSASLRFKIVCHYFKFVKHTKAQYWSKIKMACLLFSMGKETLTFKMYVPLVKCKNGRRKDSKKQ